eukprot:gnl/Chilomastix_cuspidata/1138.p1 GENE.gnl/Chilomastix_cuspidata/1138~~gnl/Chilomastix_cuspidata/1138.p1  ORF type:complete len:887 (-),score=411.31 gnl/Chilomastix_cuspidata/1138:279-2939(-)
MNVENALISAYSGETPEVQTNALGFLNHEIESNFPNYITALSHIISDVSKDFNVRQLACTQLKGAFTGSTDASRLIASQRWNALDTNIQTSIKRALFNALGDERVAQPAAIALAPISVLELVRGTWPELIADLKRLAEAGDTPVSAKVSILRALGFIAEQVQLHPNRSAILSPEHVDLMLSAIVPYMQPHIEDVALRATAATAMSHVVFFADANFAIAAEREHIMLSLLNSAVHPDPEIKTPAFRALVVVASQQYRQIDQLSPSNGKRYFENIYEVTTKQIKFVIEAAEATPDKCSYGGPEDECAVEALGFWRSLAEVEAAMAKSNPAGCKGYVKTALNWVVPDLLQAMCTQIENQEPEFINISAAAGVCLRECASATGDGIVGVVMQFVNKHVGSENWRFAEAATLAFGAIVPYCEAGLSQYISDALKFFTDKTLKHPILIVRESGAWTLSILCEYRFEEIIANGLLDSLIAAFSGSFADSPRVVSNIASAITCLTKEAHRFAKIKNEPEHALVAQTLPILQAIVQALDRADVDEAKLRGSLHRCFNQLVVAAPDKFVNQIFDLVSEFVGRCENTLAVIGTNGTTPELERQLSCLCSSLGILFQRLETNPALLRPHISVIMDMLLERIVKAGATGEVFEEALLALGSLTSVMREAFAEFAPPLFSVLLEVLNHPEYVETFEIALGVSGDLIGAVGPLFAGECNGILQRIEAAVDADRLAKASVPFLVNTLSEFSEIRREFGSVYLTPILRILSKYTKIQVENPDDLDEVDLVQNIRASIISAIATIFDVLIELQQTAEIQASLQAFVEFMRVCYMDPACLRSVLFAITGLVGDIGFAFPARIRELFNTPWVSELLTNARDLSETDVEAKNVQATVQVLASAGLTF